MTEIDRDTVIITGGNGFIGQAAVVHLRNDHRLVTLDRKCGADVAAAVDCVTVDLSSARRVRDALEQVKARHGARIASVIHLAGYFDFSGNPHPNYEKINVRGAEHLLRGLRTLEVEQFIFASTMLVHAPVEPGHAITEDAPLEPKWPYPQSKLAAEELIRAQRGDMPVLVLRLAGVYDDDCRLPFLAHQIERIYERRLIGRFYPGDARRGQAALHVDDLAEAFSLLVARRAELGGDTTLLLGETEALSYEELQQELTCLLFDEQTTVQRIPKPIAAAGAWLQDKMEPVIPDAIDKGEEPFVKPWMVAMADDHYALDTTHARALLGWHPRHTLRKTLPKMIDKLKADPLAWYQRNHLTPTPRLANRQRDVR